MKFISLLRRGWNLAKVGKAVHAMRNASDEDKKNLGESLSGRTARTITRTSHKDWSDDDHE